MFAYRLLFQNFNKIKTKTSPKPLNSTEWNRPIDNVGARNHTFCLIIHHHIRAATCDFQQYGIFTSVDSDEPLQPPIKLRNSKWSSVSSLTLIEYLSDEQRLCSDCAYAQADLRLCWSHIPHCWKYHAATHYEGCSNMNASSFITFFTYMLRQNDKRFYKGLYVTFKLAPDLKKNKVYLSSYSPLNGGHVSILTNNASNIYQ